MTAVVGLMLLGQVMLGQDVTAAAEAAGVDPILLAGAVVSTGMPPHDYLLMTGELKPPAPQRTIWDSVASCESTGRWSANTGNGYFGGVQMDMVFWRNYGGPAFASRPDLASKAQQITVAERGLAVQGWRAWPTCSRILGLR